jgi:integrase
MGSLNRHGSRWRVRWTDECGRRCSEVYASKRDAQLVLKRRELEVREVKEGWRTGKPPDKRFDDLCDYWIRTHAKVKRSGSHDESIIRAHLRPTFGALPLQALTTQHVDEFRAAKGHLHPKTVANHLTLLKTMLSRAVELGWLHRSPVVRKPKIPRQGEIYRFLQADDEIQSFLASAREESEAAFVLYATAIYTGMRAGELAGLRWSDVDFERGVITIQRSYDGPTKSGEIRRIPIFNVLRPILRAWALHRPDARHVFVNDAGNPLQRSQRVFQETLKRVLDAAGFPRIEHHGKPRHYIVFHGLRHTFASHFMMRGGDLFKLQKLLGHQSVAMTQRYAHLSPDAFAGEYDRFGGSRTDSAEICALPSP